MVARRFASLIHRCSFDPSRRTLLASAAGSLLTVLSLPPGDDITAAKKRKKRKRCKSRETRCGKKCVRGSCCPGESCALGCTCRRTISGRTFCGPDNFMAICEQCQSNDDCLEDERCAPDDQCGPEIAAVCIPVCQA